MSLRYAILFITLSICYTSNNSAALAATGLDGLRLIANVNESQNSSARRIFKSFREWKAFMTTAAQDRVKLTQALISQKLRLSASVTQDPNLPLKSMVESGLNSNLAELQRQAEKDQFQLSVAKDLTISDYFVGYLTKQKDLSAAIKEVSGRLTADEVSELMFAYANNFFSSKPTTSISPARADAN